MVLLTFWYFADESKWVLELYEGYIALFHVLGMRQAGRMGHLLNVSVPFFTFYGKDTDKSMIILGVFSGIY